MISSHILRSREINAHGDGPVEDIEEDECNDQDDGDDEVGAAVGGGVDLGLLRLAHHPAAALMHEVLVLVVLAVRVPAQEGVEGHQEDLCRK